MRNETPYALMFAILIAAAFLAAVMTQDRPESSETYRTIALPQDGTLALDARYLAHRAVRAGVDPLVVLAIAHHETRKNLNPAVLGAHGERGRFQIQARTAEDRCAGIDVTTYKGNVDCFLEMFSNDARRLGTIGAITHHNGRGPRARAYTTMVLATVGKWSVQ